jgi:RNA polymerase sigma-70 factor (ECF subfamily)
LETLCRIYWRPLYALARGRGLARPDAHDAGQDFFASARRRAFFARADEERGTLRSFLAASFKRGLLDRAAREGAEKRTPPGGWSEDDFEAAEAEWARTAAEAGAGGPDAAYARQWARELVAQAIARTGARYEAEGKADVFAALRAEALDDGEAPEAASESGGSPGARRVAVFRLRKRFAEELRAVVAGTLREGSDVEAELRELGAGLRRTGA